MESDNNYIKRLQAGDESCLEDIYVKYRSIFISWAEQQFGLDSEEARDAFQNTLIAFYENVHNGRLDNLSSSLKTYLFAIGKHKILSSKKNILFFANLNDFPDINLVDEPEDPEMNSVQTAAVHTALQQLGPDCKKVLELFYFMNSKMEFIAKTFNYKNENVAKVKKASCLRKLAAIYKMQNPF